MPPVLVCDQLNSRANLSTVVRLAGCFGVAEVYVAGSVRVDTNISRGAELHVTLVQRRTLPPVLVDLRSRGYRLVGLEQTTASVPPFAFRFPEDVALVVGNERRGL